MGTAHGNRVSFGHDENFLELDSSAGCITLQIYQKSLMVQYTSIDYMVCELYLNKNACLS